MVWGDVAQVSKPDTQTLLDRIPSSCLHNVNSPTSLWNLDFCGTVSVVVAAGRFWGRPVGRAGKVHGWTVHGWTIERWTIHARAIDAQTVRLPSGRGCVRVTRCGACNSSVAPKQHVPARGTVASPPIAPPRGGTGYALVHGTDGARPDGVRHDPAV